MDCTVFASLRRTATHSYRTTNPYSTTNPSPFIELNDFWLSITRENPLCGLV
ncbi:MAG: hypothetical protein MUO54_08800 [Anaerolineales bacterium]|nr:hypothetical protein [Anaerolineales bacterium]